MRAFGFYTTFTEKDAGLPSKLGIIEATACRSGGLLRWEAPGMKNKKRILIVEDEKPILDGLADLFTFHGYAVDSALDGKQGLSMALADRYDLIVLDVMLPSLDGFSVCNELRSRDRSTPIVMLTAKSSEDDIITGLSLGADDYVAKPFSVRELVLRVEAILRRTNGDENRERYIRLRGRMIIDGFNLNGSWEGRSSGSEALEFTRREFDILRHLLRHSDRPVGRGELLQEIWGYQRASEIETRTVDIHIAKLRKKIEPDPKEPSFLVTVRGEGYKLLEAEFASAR